MKPITKRPPQLLSLDEEKKRRSKGKPLLFINGSKGKGRLEGKEWWGCVGGAAVSGQAVKRMHVESRSRLWQTMRIDPVDHPADEIPSTQRGVCRSDTKSSSKQCADFPGSRE